MKSIRRILPLATAAAFAAPLLAHENDNFKLLASDGVAGDAFGSAVAIQGTTALIASPQADGIGADSGAVYVFTFDGTTWNEVDKLVASNAAAGALFGTAVSLDGSRLVIGAPGANGGDGAAYAFSFDGVSWSEDSILAPAGLAAGAGYGSSLDISGDSAVIGAPLGGAAYVFVDGGLGWAQEDSLSAAGASLGDLFGSGVTINGDQIAVGAANGIGTGADTGVVNTFARAAGSWSETQALMLPAGTAGDLFGAAVDMYNGDELLIGIPGHDSGGLDSGGGQRWQLNAGIWEAVQSYPGRDPGDAMGTCVTIFQRADVLGLPNDDDEADNGGSAYRFLKNSPTGLEIYVGHDNEMDDSFGSAVSVSGTWAANGAPSHDDELGTAYIHSTVQAIAEHIDGSGVNPDVLETVAGPVIGQSWDLEIDLTLFPGSELTRVVVKKDPLDVPLVTAFGEVFFSLAAPTLATNDGLGSHSIPIPSSIAFLDTEFTVMGIIYGAAIDGFPILALTNGQGIVIGTTDFPLNEADHHDDE